MGILWRRYLGPYDAPSLALPGRLVGIHIRDASLGGLLVLRLYHISGGGLAGKSDLLKGAAASIREFCLPTIVGGDFNLDHPRSLPAASRQQ